MNEESLEKMQALAARAHAKEELRRLLQLYINYLRAAGSVVELYSDEAYEEALAAGFKQMADLSRLRIEGAQRVGMVSTSLLQACVLWQVGMPAFCEQVKTNVTNCNAVLYALPTSKKPKRRKIISEFSQNSKDVLETCQRHLDRLEGGTVDAL